MTIAITHSFQSAKGDGTDATLVRPSNWNANHTTSMATGNVIGRQSAGAGTFEELPLSAFMAAALAAVDAPSLLAALGIGAFTTGDVGFTINPTAPAGWLIYNGAGTLGDATSGATVRANADCSALYQLIWNQISQPSGNALCAVTGGLGANALADFNAHKPLALPQFSGRGVIGAGTGTSLTARVVGAFGGEETHVLSVTELAAHVHANSLNDPGHSHSYADSNVNSGGGGTSVFIPISQSTQSTGVSGTGQSINNASQGGNGAHNNMQPYVALWTKVKL